MKQARTTTCELVGSFAAGRKNYKDVDILLRLSIGDATLQRNRRRIRSDIVKILRKSSYPNLDIFIHTSDNAGWRLRPWRDEQGKITWEWE